MAGGMPRRELLLILNLLIFAEFLLIADPGRCFHPA
jgi:hypothetical protein